MFDIFFMAYAITVIFGAPVLAWFWYKNRKALKASLKAQDAEKFEHSELLTKLYAELASLEHLKKYQAIPDVESHIQDLTLQASVIIRDASSEAREKMADAERRVTDLIARANQKADTTVVQAQIQAHELIARAKAEALAIAGNALDAKKKAGEYSRLVQSLKNIIEGYGDQYMVPVYSLLDELAEDFSHTDAGEKLKAARAETKRLMKLGLAAQCDYVEENRKITAIRFVVDAFNGKVDSILARSKADNYGTLRQQIIDGFQVVNVNGTAFRNARITNAYFEARLEELRWGCAAHELREKEKEEQRSIREQMREEEKAQREYEKALRDAAKEEDMLRKAMEKAREDIEAANAEQKLQYEAQLADLEAKLKIAEEKNQRVLSMAQQTKCGHVYVISNIGSFGDDVLKIGMTRRLEPKERVQELGDASVPFPFDIHAMIYCEDAPALERKLHKILLMQQVNKVNPRKEFFKTGVKSVREEFERLGIAAHWTMLAEAREYRESLQIEQSIRSDGSVAADWERTQELAL